MKIRMTGNFDRSYEILIGENLLEGIVSELRDLSDRFVIITDRNVERLYGNALLERMRREGIKAHILSFEPGEKSKNLENYNSIMEKLVSSGLDRGSALIALGGGVPGDITGFAASTYMRGIKFIQVPTTLLAMVDSSIGGKTGVNLRAGKNLVGTFHQPEKVFIDTSTLDTLPEEEFTNGLIELVKHALIRNRTLADFIEKNIGTIMKREKGILEEIITESLKIKADIVEKDEKESGLRMLLNYGHTFGHAFETLSDSGIAHGEAVAAGMMIAGRLSNRVGKLSGEELERHNGLIEKILEVSIPAFVTEEIMEKMLSDKKARDGKIKFVLLKKVGEAYVDENVPLEIVREVLND
jgi:3-dehydroquinate synthase